MREDAFEQEYAAMTDDQLMAVAAHRKELLPEALTALDRELQRRRVIANPATQWKPDPDLDDGTRCLEDDCRYRGLVRQKRFLDRFWYWIAFAPFAIMLLSAKYASKDPETYWTAFGWFAMVAGFWLFTRLRISSFTCPQCAQRFGSGTSCYRCGFPRTSADPWRGIPRS
jgi:hypothetical protein